jgi:HAMP domain-containing protein
MAFRVPLPLKLMLSYLVVAAFITLPALWFLRGALTESLESAEQGDLFARADAARARLAPLEGPALDNEVREIANLLGLRVTVVDRSGRVLADSSVAADAIAAMENHLDRPEVKAAFTAGHGVDVRRSETLAEELVYAAVPIERDANPLRVLRLAAPRSKIRAVVQNAFLALRVGIGVGVSTALLLSLVAAFYVSAPLRRMRDVAKAYAAGRWPEVTPLKSRDELEDLSVALMDLGRQLRAQLITAEAPHALLARALDASAFGALFSPGGEPLHVTASFRDAERWTPQVEQRAAAAIKSAIVKAGAKGAAAGPIAVDVDVDGVRVPFELLPLSPADGHPYWLARSRSGMLVETRKAILDLLAGIEAKVRAAGDRKLTSNTLRDLDEIAVLIDDIADARRATKLVDSGALAARCSDDVASEGATARITLANDSATDLIVDADGFAARCLRGVLRAALNGDESRELSVSATANAKAVTFSIDAPMELVSERSSDVAKALRAAGATLSRSPEQTLCLTLPRG